MASMNTEMYGNMLIKIELCPLEIVFLHAYYKQRCGHDINYIFFFLNIDELTVKVFLSDPVSE